MDGLLDLQERVETYLRDHPTLEDFVLTESLSWEANAQFCDEKYSRITLHRRREEPSYEIVLVCWGPQQKSDVHNHPVKGCAMKVLAGELFEERFCPNSSSKLLEKTHIAGDCSYIHDSECYHSLGNVSQENAVSLHIYAPTGYIPEMPK